MKILQASIAKYRWVCASFLIALAGYSFANAGKRTVISQGDCLSCIAERHIGHPVYGDNGSLELLLKLNQWIENPNWVRKGSAVRLPELEDASSFRPSSNETISAACRSLAQETFVLSSGLPVTSSAISQGDTQALESEIQSLKQNLQETNQELEITQELLRDHKESHGHDTLAVKEIHVERQVVSEVHDTPKREDDVFKNTSRPAYDVSLYNRKYYFGFGVNFHRIDGLDRNNNTQAKLKSDLSWALEFGWKTPFRVHEKYFTHINLHTEYYRYAADLNNSVLENQSIITPGFRVGVGRNFWKQRISLEGYIGVDREFYYFAPSLNVVEFDADWIGKLGFESDIRVLNGGKWKAGLRPRIEFMALGDFLNDGGWYASGDVYLRRKQHELRFGYARGDLKSETLDYDTYEINAMYRMNF